MLDVVAIILQHTGQYNDGMPYSSVGRMAGKQSSEVGGSIPPTATNDFLTNIYFFRFDGAMRL